LHYQISKIKNRKMKKLIMLVALPLSLSTMFTSCDIPTTPAPVQQASSGAKTMNIAHEFQIPTNAEGNTSEQQNILDQKKVTSDPTRILWMHLVDMNGRMYLRTPVRCKITSSGKRLEPTSCAAGLNGGQYDTWYGAPAPHGLRTTELIQIDGTYGSSDPYVYWFDPMGNYFQKGDGYILSTMPIDIKNPIDEITGLYRANEAADKWAKEQEAKLKK
jgi:hypothetical protein